MIKVLIADDEPGILLSLEFLMKKEGHQVFIARDGREALTLIKQEKPQVLVLDVMMPRMDGLEVCRAVRAEPAFSATKIIFLSARNKEIDVRAGLEAGADLYLAKPFSTRELVKQINALLPVS